MEISYFCMLKGSLRLVQTRVLLSKGAIMDLFYIYIYVCEGWGERLSAAACGAWWQQDNRSSGTAWPRRAERKDSVEKLSMDLNRFFLFINEKPNAGCWMVVIPSCVSPLGLYLHCPWHLARCMLGYSSQHFLISYLFWKMLCKPLVEFIVNYVKKVKVI